MKRKRRRRAGAARAMALLALSSCGAKTELRVPVTEVCNVGALSLPSSRVEAMLLVDRSGSMNEVIVGASSRETRWDAMRSALAATLPTYTQRVELGLWPFPSLRWNASCAVEADPRVSPAFGSASAIVDIIRRATPDGLTPTTATVLRASEWLRAHATPDAALALVIATDGEPNCGSDAFDLSAKLAELSAQGIRSYVIGIDGGSQRLSTTLDALAVAGGRPRPAGASHRYYDANSAENLTAAFDAIQSRIASCSRVAPTRPPPGAEMRIDVNDTRLSRDPTHRDGWDWTDDTGATLDFYGPACDAIAHATAAVTVRYDCR